jgi:ABC-2 type transport system permease protein
VAIHPAQTLRKWRAVFSIFFQEGLAYRASGIIWIMTDLVTAITMPLVWTQTSALQNGPIAGFSASDFVLYYLILLLIGSFISSHIIWEIAEEIREGKFSNQLLRPISHIQYSFFRNGSWRVMRTMLFLPIFVVLLFVYRELIGQPRVNLGIEFWLALILGHMVSFFSVYALSMLALFIEEAYTVFELYYVPMLFLSGRVFPVSVMPDWAVSLSLVFPFYYTTGLPTEIAIGKIQGATAWTYIGIQCGWIVGCYLISQVLWRKGLRHYSAVGM